MLPVETDLHDAAALWIARSRDPAFSDWEELTRWLEADAAHNAAYEAAFRAHDVAGLLRSAPLDDRERRPGSGRAVLSRHRWKALAWPVGVAAAVAVLTIGVPMFLPGHGEYTLATRLGERRIVRLEDGSVIDLNGGSRLVLDRAKPRFARLDAGEARFSVVHDDDSPFAVEAGGTRMIDLGTRFNVVRSGKLTEVAVADGAVLYDPAGAAVQLREGRMLRATDDSQIVAVSDVDPGAVGSWRSGRLVFTDAPLSRVAEDLSRSLGEPVAVSPELRYRTFTGGIMVDGIERKRLLAQVAAVLGVTATHRRNGWLLTAGARAPR